MKYTSVLLIVVASFIFVGCKYIDGSTCPTTERGSPHTPTNVWYTVRHQPNTNSAYLPLRYKLNPIWWLGNHDDPDPPYNYHTNSPFRRVMWWSRNPFHNFTFYVIGISDKDFVISGRYPEDTFNPYDRWQYTLSKAGRLRLPFVSYQHKRFHFYLGWRTGGNFGMKFNWQNVYQPPKPVTEIVPQ